MGCQPSKDAGPKKPKKQPYLLQDIKDHKGGINCMVLSDDGSLLVTGSDDKTARMWSTLSDPTECLGMLEGHEGWLQLLPPPARAVPANIRFLEENDEWIEYKLYSMLQISADTYHGVPVVTKVVGTKKRGYITCCAVHEQCVLTGSSDATIRKWFIATAECMGIYTGHSSRISRLLCVGQLFFSTSSDHTVRAWLFDLKEISDDQGEACIKVFEASDPSFSSIATAMERPHHPYKQLKTLVITKYCLAYSSKSFC
ncbi:UNVERIFIED_CONTAM: WD repeat-containing protein 86 [Trichonephila clavipes]